MCIYTHSFALMYVYSDGITFILGFFLCKFQAFKWLALTQGNKLALYVLSSADT